MGFRAFTFIITCDLMVKMGINHVVCTATTNWEMRIIVIFRAGPKKLKERKEDRGHIARIMSVRFIGPCNRIGSVCSQKTKNRLRVAKPKRKNPGFSKLFYSV